MILYMDSSSIVKLYVLEPESAETRHAVTAADGVATSRVTYSEVRAALARARRDRRIRSIRAYSLRKQEFQDDWPSFIQIEVSQDLVQAAGDLADRYALSGFDAIHLSAALALKSRGIDEIEVSTFDIALRAAALAEGLSLAHEHMR